MFPTTYAKKGSLEIKKGRGVTPQCVMSIPPQASSLESILAKIHAHTYGKILRCTKYRLRTRQVKVTGQRKLGRNVP